MISRQVLFLAIGVSVAGCDLEVLFGSGAATETPEVCVSTDTGATCVPDQAESGDEGGVDTPDEDLPDQATDTGFADHDGDGVPDAEDVDADGDGIPDDEQGCGGEDLDEDGVPDATDPDDDGDGLEDVFDADPCDPDVY